MQWKLYPGYRRPPEFDRIIFRGWNLSGMAFSLRRIDFMQDRRDQELLKMLKPLEHRPYRMKRPALRFFCPLCRSERSISTRPRLSRWNYVQIVIASVFFFMVLFPFMEGNSFYLGFVIWIGAEAVVRLRFKKKFLVHTAALMPLGIREM